MTILGRYDTTKPIIYSLEEASFENNGKLTDSEFSQILEAYEIPEDREEEIMSQMLNSKEFRFSRGSGGWWLNEK